MKFRKGLAVAAMVMGLGQVSDVKADGGKPQALLDPISECRLERLQLAETSSEVRLRIIGLLGLSGHADTNACHTDPRRVCTSERLAMAGVVNFMRRVDPHGIASGFDLRVKKCLDGARGNDRFVRCMVNTVTSAESGAFNALTRPCIDREFTGEAGACEAIVAGMKRVEQEENELTACQNAWRDDIEATSFIVDSFQRLQKIGPSEVGLILSKPRHDK
ncbi:MAG: hypothetical protein ABIH78_02370 [Candidatus Peregrinibacteria bacterium]